MLNQGAKLCRSGCGNPVVHDNPRAVYCSDLCRRMAVSRRNLAYYYVHSQPKRRHGERSRAIAAPPTEEERAEAKLALLDVDRPKTRGDCEDMPRPCPFVSCKYHLALDVSGINVKLNFPDREVWELDETCALDVADRGGVILETVGELLNLTRERIRQIEVRALLKLKAGEPNGEENPLK
jgi:hypothetical protein